MNDLDNLRDNYSRMSYDRIYKIVENDILLLTKDDLQVLSEELVTRGMPPSPQIDYILEIQRTLTTVSVREQDSDKEEDLQIHIHQDPPPDLPGEDSLPPFVHLPKP